MIFFRDDKWNDRSQAQCLTSSRSRWWPAPQCAALPTTTSPSLDYVMVSTSPVPSYSVGLRISCHLNFYFHPVTSRLIETIVYSWYAYILSIIISTTLWPNSQDLFGDHIVHTLATPISFKLPSVCLILHSNSPNRILLNQLCLLINRISTWRSRYPAVQRLPPDAPAAPSGHWFRV